MSALEQVARNRSDVEVCRQAIKVGSKTFYAASLLLPAEVRRAAMVLYAFCRLADDTVDVEGGTTGCVQRLSLRLDHVYDGTPLPEPVDRALARVVVDFAIPRAILDALLEGMTWDAEGRAYETVSELKDYAARVAGTVGAMTCLLMGRRDVGVLARACDLGVAMQFTNIARDVGEDARAGRLYLPRVWMREAGLDPDAWLQDPVFDDDLGLVVQRLLDTADALYQRAELGIARLPWKCRPAIYAARHFYAEIGREVERYGLDSVSRRAVVPASRKAMLLPRSVAAAWRPVKWRSSPPLQATRFLVDAVADSGMVPAGMGEDLPSWWQVDRRVERTMDMFIRLHEMDRARMESAMQARRAET